MKKLTIIFLLITKIFAAEQAANALEDLADEHENVFETHEEQIEILTKTLRITLEILIIKENVFFEMTKEADLLYLIIQGEAERRNMLLNPKNMIERMMK